MSSKLLIRLLLAGCLLLQLAAPAFACQHVASADCHHCCHDSGDGDADDPAPLCAHCLGHGQTFSVTAPEADPVALTARDCWRASSEGGPPSDLPDPLFKPPKTSPSV